MDYLDELRKCLERVKKRFGQDTVVKFDHSLLFDQSGVTEGYWLWIYPESVSAIYGQGKTCDEAYGDLLVNYENIYGDDSYDKIDKGEGEK